MNAANEKKIYAQMIKDATEYIKEKNNQFFSNLSVRTQYGNEIEVEN